MHAPANIAKSVQHSAAKLSSSAPTCRKRPNTSAVLLAPTALWPAGCTELKQNGRTT